MSYVTQIIEFSFDDFLKIWAFPAKRRINQSIDASACLKCYDGKSQIIPISPRVMEAALVLRSHHFTQLLIPPKVNPFMTHHINRFITLSLFFASFAFSPISPTQAEEKENFYDPIEKQLSGWTIAVDPKLLLDENKATAEKAFEALANHLQRITYIVSDDKLTRLKKLRIWIELDNSKLSNMQYHPSRGWLLANGHDPRLVKHVHIPRAKNLFAASTWAKHPYVVLHELAHSYHDQFLGFENPEVEAVYQSAKKEGIYDQVMSHTGRTVRHYGLNNAKEYFAESTEAYFGVNDFYPFVRAELKSHDPKMYDLLVKLWGRIR